VHPTLLNTLRKALKMMGVSDTDARKRIILAGEGGKGLQGWQQADELLGKGQLDKEEPFDGDAADETALLCYSSGTTSKSKGVEASIIR
jgi:4-coumarate--CoA ligase